MATDADGIASAVLEEFRKLPAKRKPAVRDNGLREWVPLSGIVVEGPNFLKCVALATGMKCLPASKVSQANGVALHDWHAEVLAIRAFSRFLLNECRRLAQDSSAESEYLLRRTREELPASSNNSWHCQPFTWREDLTLHMYCSEAPCGDASMELIMSSQADATPWTIPPSPSSSPTTTVTITSTPLPPNPPTTSPITSSPPPPPPQPPLVSPLQPQRQPEPQSTPTTTPLLLGRAFFSHLGIVRRKPARADAPPTHSKSCSDKLALKQCASLLSSPACLLVSPQHCYLSTLVLPASQYSAAACRRCFSAGSQFDANANADTNHSDGGSSGGGSYGGGGGGGGGGRMAAVRGRVWEGTGYEFVPFRVEVTGLEFEFSRRGICGSAGDGGGDIIKVVASNLAVAWTADGEVDEGLIGGVLQGRKAFDLRGASLTSRRRMWAAAVEVAGLLGDEGMAKELEKGTYDGLKEGELLAARTRIKEEVRTEVLKGWLRNCGDGGFTL
ncbi:hypothetical protein N658DRAFT_423017 [Parathielavia hyrcaniae]|uniref:A to I editase domain-containing protein n=1 Tax=Parathielavia hyrcaniae TaxID=113614 RepID=A0AAN6T3S5_9PEZI|nr:hypothetical protein N658DRAFT_423017 [Parathielavia hyrcaniae]